MEFITHLFRGLVGILLLLTICWICSNNRRRINWRLVGVGVLMQFALAILILKVPFVNQIFDWMAGVFATILRFSDTGAAFLFGNLILDVNTFGYIFAFRVLPTIIFFSALSAILYHFGILQMVVRGMAWVMLRTMGLSGPESLAAAANVFIGQTEAPLVVKPYLENLSRSEMLCLMTGGMATIAGGVFAAYIGFLGGDDPELQKYFAKHLLTASIISAPAAIVAAKMIYPEVDKKDLDRQLVMSDERANNLLDAISRGTTDGLKLAINVGVMLLVFTALIYLANEGLVNTLGKVSFVSIPYLDGTLNETVIAATDGRFDGLNFTYLLGLIFAPFAYILGTPAQDILMVGQLLGEKTVVNEFIAYADLQNIRESGIALHPKSILIATYALCGFANFASIGIQIGGIGAIAPGQRKNLTELGIRALIGGTIACFITAAIAGILFSQHI